MIKKKSQIMKIDTDPKQRSKNFPVVLHLDVVPVPLFLKPDIVNLMEKKNFFLLKYEEIIFLLKIKNFLIFKD